MKRIAIISSIAVVTMSFLTVSFSSGSASVNYRTAIEQYFSVKMVFGEPVLTLFRTLTIDYDAKGNLVKKQWKVIDTSIDMTIGSRQPEWITRTMHFNRMPDFLLYKYDDNNNCVEENGIRIPNELLYKITTRFDSQSRKIEQNVYDGQGQQVERYAYSYNVDGRLTNEAIFQANNSSCKMKEYTYDGNKRIQKIEVRMSNGQGLGNIGYEYDSLGRTSVFKELEFGVSSSQTVYTYNQSGQLSSKTVYNTWPSANNEILSKMEYEYSSGGRLVTEKRYRKGEFGRPEPQLDMVIKWTYR